MRTKTPFLFVCAALALATTFGCSTAAPKKYVFFGEPVPQEVEIFEDFWADEPNVFKPDDPELPLRRGKGGVVRFFKKGCYTKSILVDGTLTVNVYDGVDDGITLTQPDARLVVSSKDLNEKYRKYDKKIGYTYNIWLDLGEYDQPEKEITILSVFKDEKTGRATLSKPIRTIASGTSPLPEKKPDSDAENWARKKLGDESSDPIGALQRRYSTRNAEKRAQEERKSKTRVRDTIELSADRLRSPDDDAPSDDVSLLEAAQARRDATMARLLEENREKSDYYREKRRAEREEYRAETEPRFDRANASLGTDYQRSGTLNFQDARPDYRGEAANFAAQTNALTERFSREAQEAEERRAAEPAVNRRETAPLTLGYDAEALAAAERKPTTERRKKKSVYAADSSDASPSAPFVARVPSDGLDDFQPDSDAPPTAVYVGRAPNR